MEVLNNEETEQKKPAQYQFYVEGIRTFLEVVNRAGIGKAARQLGVNQSAVSQQISRLEQVLGRKLFERSKFGVVLTDDGEAFLAYARSITSLTDDLRRHFSQAKTSASLIVGMNEMFSRMALPEILSLLAERHPDVRLRVQTGSPKSMKRHYDAGDLDVLVTTAFEESTRPETFWTERLVWIGRKGDQRPIADPIPLVLPEPPSLLRNAIFATLNKHNRSWKIILETSNISCGEAAISAGFGYCAVPRAMRLQGPVHLDASCGLPDMLNATFEALRHPKSPDTAAIFCEILCEAAQAGFSGAGR